MFTTKLLGKLTTLFFLLSTLLCASESSLMKLAKDPTLKWGGCPTFMGKECKIAVLHGDPAKRNSDVFFKVPGDYKIPLHWHTSAERMVLVSGKLDVVYAGEKRGTMVPGTYAYGPAKKHHKAYCHKGNECILFIAFEEPIDAFEVNRDLWY